MGEDRGRPRRGWRMFLVTGAVLLAVLTAGCGLRASPTAAGDGGGAVRPVTTTTTRPSRADLASEPIAVDWTARTVDPAEVDGWSVAFCEGDGPFVCFSRGARIVGAIELFDYPVGTHDVVRRALGGGSSEVDALEALAADSLASSQDDRRRGCGPQYEVAPDRPVELSVAGEPGLRYGWTATVEGQTAERVVTYAAIRGDTLYLITVGALGERGCLARMNEFTPAELEEVLPILDRVAAGSRLPAAST